MSRARALGRRSFLSRIVGAGAAIGAVGLLTGPARAQQYSGVTDCDVGNPQDRPGYGTGTRNQYTDQDTGQGADARCHGRGPVQTRAPGGPSGVGTYSSGATYCSDRDPTDPGGRGRTCREGQAPETSGCTDHDPSNGGDVVGNGRHCS